MRFIVSSFPLSACCDAHDVLERDGEHQADKQCKAACVHPAFVLCRNRPAEDRFDDEEHEPSAVERRQRQQIHDAEVHGDHKHDVHDVVDRRTEALLEPRACGLRDRLRRTDRTRKPAKSKSACHHADEAVEDHAHGRVHIRERVFDERPRRSFFAQHVEIQHGAVLLAVRRCCVDGHIVKGDGLFAALYGEVERSGAVCGIKRRHT